MSTNFGYFLVSGSRLNDLDTGLLPISRSDPAKKNLANPYSTNTPDYAGSGFETQFQCTMREKKWLTRIKCYL